MPRQGFVVVFLDGPAQGQHRTWAVGNPPTEITLIPINERWEMVDYTGLPTGPRWGLPAGPWPEQVTYRINGVDLSSPDEVPEIHYKAVEEAAVSGERLRVDVLYQATVYVTVYSPRRCQGRG